MRRELSLLVGLLLLPCAAMACGGGFGFVGAFASAVSSLIPTRRSRAGFFASSVGPTLAREALLRKRAAERPLRRVPSCERQKPGSSSKSKARLVHLPLGQLNGVHSLYLGEHD